MSHASKAKAKGIGASSFFDLKAELAKQEEEFTRSKAAGQSTTIVGGVKRPGKKPTVWYRQNKGVNARASRDIELEAISKPTLESARAALERKAKIYDKLKKGKSGGLNDKQYDMLLVDFDAKMQGDEWESDSDDVDESVQVARPPGALEDDPIIEYEDEFGRMRTGRRSEVPRNLLPNSDNEEEDDDEDIIIRNPTHHFPVYEPSAERVADIAKAHAEETNPLGAHYDASQEVRAKGAGFYQFSGDEATRLAQMAELKASRDETERTRQEMGAVDVKPGEVEGMQDDEAGGSGTVKSRAMEKRKREIEERRKLLNAKRRKVKGGTEEQQLAAEATLQPTEGTATPVFTAGIEIPVFKAAAASADPFKALEIQEQAQSRASKPSNSKGKGKAKADAPPINEADAFLAQLELDMLSKGKGR